MEQMDSMVDLPVFVPASAVAQGIFISGWRATMFADLLHEAGIRHVLKLYDGPPHFPQGFVTCENAIEDGEAIPPEQLRRGAAFVADAVRAGQPVLVMCGAGISRSSTFVLAGLLELGYDLRAAYDLLRRQHPPAAPHLRLWASLLGQYDTGYSLQDTLGWVHAESADRSQPRGAIP
jgi:hypothetical protein